ncbi:MAG TPA: helix-turn-helix domain-containing protein, partial [Roseiflexaceae bacterium]|nr:helix-turn-helix domain-containing protein [Roseiflexaceae bacterium]
MNNPLSFGVWVRRQRKALDLTQAELARRAGCTSSMLRKIETNVRRPSRQLTARLATILGVPENDRERFQQAARSGIPDQLATNGMPGALPLGTVTFLMSDIEGSTRLWEQHPPAMQHALARHDALLRSIITAHDGIVLKSMGDGLHAVFASASQALQAALAAQQSLLAERWETPTPLRARMALYAGKAEMRDGDYFGLALSRAARLVATGYGGQILVSQTVVDQVQGHMPPGSELRDLGVHHLRDLHEPEHVYQLVAPALPSAFPMLSTPDARLADMPLQLSTLVGRAHEVEQLTALLQSGKRLVTLTGLGGVGKTRLALQVVTLVVGKYRDGVWFVDLAPATTVEQLLSRVAQALGFDEQPVGNLVGKIQAWLSDKQALLLLDNLEQIPSASEPITDWLRSAPGLTLLITSRVSLQLNGEQELPIAPLALPDL